MRRERQAVARQVASITSTFNPQLGNSHLCIPQQERKEFRKFFFRGAKFAPCPALGGGRKDFSSQSPTWKVLQPPGASHPAQQPPLCSTANLTPKKVTSLRGNRSHGRMSTTYCHEMSSRTEVALSHTHPRLPPPCQVCGAGGVTLPELPCSPSSLLSPAPKPSLPRLSSLGAPTPKDTSVFQPGRGHSHCHPSTGWSLVSPTSPAPQGTHSHRDLRGQPGCCPCSRSNRASRQAPAPPWQQRERREGRRQRAHEEVQRWLPAVPLLQHSICQLRGDPESIRGAQAWPQFKSSHRDLLPTCSCLSVTQTSRISLSCRGTDTGDAWLAVPYPKRVAAPQESTQHCSKHTAELHSHIPVCATLKHSSS